MTLTAMPKMGHPSPNEPRNGLRDGAVTLRTLAAAALDASGGIIADAVDALSSRLINDDDVLFTILREIVVEAAASATRREIMQTRASIVYQADHSAGRRGVVALSSAMATTLLDFPLGDGTRLRDATRAQVEASAARYEKVSSEMARRGRWLRLIAENMGASATVGAAISEKLANDLLSRS